MTNCKLSVLIPASNSANLLLALFDDIKWADEILVVDSFSTDDTLKICEEHGVRVIQHKYVNSAKQKNWAIPQCSHEWVLIIDTDERLPIDLQQEIQQVLNTTIPENIVGYRIARKTMFLEHWLKVMRLWPDYQVRLFRRDTGRYEDKEVHADIVTDGQISTLEYPLIHNATPTLSKQISLLDRYSTYQADELEKRGRKFSWFNLVMRPIGIFLYLYIYKLGFTAGFRGLFIAFHSMAFTFFTYAKLWEKQWLKNR